MAADTSEWIGIVAGICTSVSLVPQLYKIIKTKKAENISYAMLGILIAGLAFWVIYGWKKKDIPVLITNAFAVVINLLTLIFSIKYKEKQSSVKR